jgi:capsular exopolysaccharide synthesis family protein
MGKVYDALRRAEEQRAERVQETVDSGGAMPLAIPAVPEASGMDTPAPAPARRKSSLLDKLRSATASTTESASDLNKRRIALLQPESFVAEQFRTLRARLDSLGETRPVGTVAITSARRGEGKTMAAISLAAVTAMQPGRRVLLIDCDLRAAAVASALGLRVDAGLAEVLSGSAGLEEAICKADGTDLDVLAVRGTPSNPSELLASESMARLLGAASQAYDRVVLDLPPVLGIPDAKSVSGLCDGVVFMVRAGVTPSNDVEGAIEILDRTRILGLVMNGEATEAQPYGSA